MKRKRYPSDGEPRVKRDLVAIGVPIAVRDAVTGAAADAREHRWAFADRVIARALDKAGAA